MKMSVSPSAEVLEMAGQRDAYEVAKERASSAHSHFTAAAKLRSWKVTSWRP